MMIITTLGAIDANSYADIVTADAFHKLRNNQAWADAAESAKTAALVRATDYLDANYIYVSVPATEFQALEHPRISNPDILDARIVKATIMLAEKFLTDDPLATPSPTVISTTEKLEGVGESSTTYAAPVPVSDPYPQVTRTLGKMAVRRGGGFSNIRMR
ncbi:hypothetical protein GRI62_11860 [Erythrobacter arachoides]|uniref:Putative DnaT-like domain-containing protein n=1 Tax=Aurantiacibacter arachoides TaxID=1850444 RepID=A0A845A174_9SPHN|nr:DnaT-like ssDNA-binding protein [Aurantiacibacter arachoides]MXO94291.1 hypothetical protein [Aurantiacibacter arachoides]GGD64607.1 hypothetical protein GCM10011411_26170 [Aurantiacibacter arachoides]